MFIHTWDWFRVQGRFAFKLSGFRFQARHLSTSRIITTTTISCILEPTHTHPHTTSKEWKFPLRKLASGNFWKFPWKFPLIKCP